MANPDSGTYWKSGVGWVSPGSEYYSPPPSGPSVVKVTPPNTSGSFYEKDTNNKQVEPVMRGGETFLVEKGTVTQKEEQVPSPLKVPTLPNAAPTTPTTKQPELSDVKLKQEGGKATLTFAETGAGRSFSVGEQAKVRSSPFLSPYDKSLPMPEGGKPIPEMVKIESPKIFEVPKGSLSKYGEGWEGATGFQKHGNIVTPIIFFEKGGNLPEDYILTHELTHGLLGNLKPTEKDVYAYAEKHKLKDFGEIKEVNVTQRFTDMNVSKQYELVPTTGGVLFGFDKNKLLASVKQSTKDYAPLSKLASSFQKSEFGQGVQSTVPLGLGIAGLAVVSPVAGSVAIGGLLGYSAVATGASMAEKGFVRTIKEDFLSPRAIGSQVGFGVAAPFMPKVPKLFKVKTAGGATLKEVGNINAGIKKASIEVHPIDVSEYYTKNPPKSEPTVTMRGTERTQVIAKGAVADVTARVQKTAPTGLITEAPRGSGYAGSTRLFEPAKQAENVNKIVQDVVKNIPKPSEVELNKPSLAAGVVERMAKAKDAGRGIPESKLSPVTQKLLDSTEVGASAGIDVNSIYGVQTRIGVIKSLKQFGSSVKIGSVARINALKDMATGKILREASAIKGTVSSDKPIFGKVFSSNVAKRAQAGGTTLIESKAKIYGRVPELAYTKEGEYAFFGKAGKQAGPQDMIIKAPGGWRGLKRTALEAKKSVMAKAVGLKVKGQNILSDIKKALPIKKTGIAKVPTLIESLKIVREATTKKPTPKGFEGYKPRQLTPKELKERSTLPKAPTLSESLKIVKESIAKKEGASKFSKLSRPISEAERLNIKAQLEQEKIAWSKLNKIYDLPSGTFSELKAMPKIERTPEFIKERVLAKTFDGEKAAAKYESAKQDALLKQKELIEKAKLLREGAPPEMFSKAQNNYNKQIAVNRLASIFKQVKYAAYDLQAKVAQKATVQKAAALKASGVPAKISVVNKPSANSYFAELGKKYSKVAEAKKLADKMEQQERLNREINRAYYRTAQKGVELKERGVKEVKSASGQSLAQKIEQDFNKADYDKPISQMVPARQVISAERVTPKPPFGVGNMVSGAGSSQGSMPQYQPKVSMQAKTYIPKERNAQTTKQTPSLNVKQYESQIKLTSNIPTQRESVVQKLGVEPILRQGVGGSIMQDVNIRQDIAQINVQVPKQKQITLQTQKQVPRNKPPRVPDSKLSVIHFGSESRRIKISVKSKQPKILSKKGKPWRSRLATWENVSITEAATGKKAHHQLLIGKAARRYDIQSAYGGVGFRYPTLEQKRGLR